MGRYAHGLLLPFAGMTTALLPESYPESRFPTVHRGNSFFPWWEQVILPRLCLEHGITRLLCPYNTAPIRLPASVELLLVVHDLIYLEPWARLPPSVSVIQTLGRIYRRHVVPLAIQRAAKLITVSEYTRDQLSQKFSIPKERIWVIPNSLGDSWYVDDGPLTPNDRKPYLLCVSGEAPSKNVGAFIRAFSKFRAMLGSMAEELSLRIVGIKQPYQSHFRRLAEDAGIANIIRFEPYLNESALQQLYREAWLFSMPSLYEGFGIPVLEAMASGTPVACSNTTSLPEVVGGAGWLFDPRDESDMARQLYAAWTDHIGRIERAQCGVIRAQMYRRTAIAESIINFWGAA